jgi:hypothetical protein
VTDCACIAERPMLWLALVLLAVGAVAGWVAHREWR